MKLPAIWSFSIKFEVSPFFQSIFFIALPLPTHETPSGPTSSFHSITPTKTLLYFPSLGWAGVALFFVVSGFCIHLSHARSKEKGFRIFFIRRFFRIWPPFVLALVFFTCLNGAGFANFISHLFLVHNLLPAYALSINGSFWSIGTEVQLYILYPVVLWLAAKAGWARCLLFVLAIEIFFRLSPSLISHLRGAAGDLDPNMFNHNPLYFWFSWTIGAKIADDWINRRPIFLARWPIWPWIVLFLLSALVTPLGRFSFTLASLSTAAVIAALLTRPLDFKWLTNLFLADHFRKAGVVSYSVYLLHEFFLQLPALVLSRFPSVQLGAALMFLVLVLEWPLALLLGYASYRLLELPSIAIGKALIRSERQALNAAKVVAD